MERENERRNRVLEIFQQICSIPHPSGSERALAEWIEEFAASHGLSAVRDASNNVIVKVPATPGLDRSKPVILQAHIDMVCVAKDADHDFLKHPISIRQTEDWLSADGTSLGADDGIGVATILSLITDPSVRHPEIEAVFTASEETGMYGAEALDLSELRGTRLINLDSEEEGIAYVSCAGGEELCFKKEFMQAVPTVAQGEELKLFRCKISGLKGGHSGTEIHKCRANAIWVLSRALERLARDLGELLVCSFCGGTRKNVIPDWAEAEFYFRARQAKAEPTAGEGKETHNLGESEKLPDEALIKNEVKEVLAEYSAQEPDRLVEVQAIGTLNGFAEYSTLEGISSPAPKALGYVTSLEVLGALGDPELKSPVVSYSKQISGMVQTSFNLAVLKLVNAKLEMHISLRSNSDNELKELEEKVASHFKGMELSVHNPYPAWEYKEKGELEKTFCEEWKRQFSSDLKVLGIHAGLECALFTSRKPGLDCISIGPTIEGAHSVEERVCISSVDRLYSFLAGVLASQR